MDNKDKIAIANVAKDYIKWTEDVNAWAGTQDRQLGTLPQLYRHVEKKRIRSLFSGRNNVEKQVTLRALCAEIETQSPAQFGPAFVFNVADHEAGEIGASTQFGLDPKLSRWYSEMAQLAGSASTSFPGNHSDFYDNVRVRYSNVKRAVMELFGFSGLTAAISFSFGSNMDFLDDLAREQLDNVFLKKYLVANSVLTYADFASRSADLLGMPLEVEIKNPYELLQGLFLMDDDVRNHLVYRDSHGEHIGFTTVESHKNKRRVQSGAVNAKTIGSFLVPMYENFRGAIIARCYAKNVRGEPQGNHALGEGLSQIAIGILAKSPEILRNYGMPDRIIESMPAAIIYRFARGRLSNSNMHLKRSDDVIADGGDMGQLFYSVEEANGLYSALPDFKNIAPFKLCTYVLGGVGARFLPAYRIADHVVSRIYNACGDQWYKNEASREKVYGALEKLAFDNAAQSDSSAIVAYARDRFMQDDS